MFPCNSLDRSGYALTVVHLARVPAELKFVQVAWEMFSAHAVKRSHDSASNQGEHAFNRVGVCVCCGPHILFRAVRYRFVAASECPFNATINREFIGSLVGSSVDERCNFLHSSFRCEYPLQSVCQRALDSCTFSSLLHK